MVNGRSLVFIGCVETCRHSAKVLVRTFFKFNLERPNTTSPPWARPYDIKYVQCRIRIFSNSNTHNLLAKNRSSGREYSVLAMDVSRSSRERRAG